ncbi:ABC transporter ATP-binding protein [Niallia sp. 01092]|uniref:ABC transporter ATP-binding protein n=1 Tax=unclassified Niallia TaxID=2837522 RepID=UPI003FD1D891
MDNYTQVPHLLKLKTKLLPKRKTSSLLKPYILKHWKIYLSLMFSIILDIFITIIFAWFLGEITNAAINSELQKIKQLIPLGAVIVFVNLSNTFFNTYLDSKATNAIKNDLREDLLSHLLRLPVNKTAGFQTGELLAHFTNDINSIDAMIGKNLFNFVKLPLMSITVFIYLFHLSWQLSIISICIAPIALVSGVLFGMILRKNSRKIHQIIGKMNNQLSDIFQGTNVVRSFLLEKILSKKYTSQNKKLYSLELSNGKMRGLYNAGGNGIGLIAYLISLSFGAVFISKGTLTVGALLTFVNLINHLVYPLNGLAGQWAAFQRSAAAVERLSVVFKHATETNDFPIFTPKKPLKREIVFQNITFGYDPNHVILKDFNLEIPAGKTIGIVGVSGTGKTTLFQLLLGFYKVNNGNIFLDGVSIKDLSPSDLRSYIAYVPQETYLFNGTIKENLMYSNPNTTENKIVKAAKLAEIHDFIESLPHGYDTEIGERGAKLSGGQKQRLAIARGILKEAPIILMDESTASLDSETEYKIKHALEKLKGNRTTIIIAHRLSTIKQADKIIVMNNGKIVQSGKHEELIKQGGVYKDLYFKQGDTVEEKEAALSMID